MRIYREKVNLNKQNVKKFFQGRGKNISKDPLTAVLYQDKNPELAHERDVYETEKITPLLNVDKDSILLDIGCGIGRWAKILAPKIEKYYGIDFSEDFIQFAKTQYKSYENVTFKTLDALSISSKTLEGLTFNRVIIAGLLLYLNDQEVKDFSTKLKKLLDKNALIYLREPIAVEDRLSLDNIWSDDLNQNYSAIYRTKKELLELLGPVKILMDDDMYTSNLNNRVETKQHFFIFQY